MSIDNPHYHCQEKGCKIEHISSIKEGRKFETFDYAICNTHNIKICRCGFEFGFHYNSESKKLKCFGKRKTVICEYI